jgi:amidohydrolase
MLEEGLIDPLPDMAFALHVSPNIPSGSFGSKTGTLLASADVLSINITGKGGHASLPHDAVDPIPIACEIVLALQSMVTRTIVATDPVVLTIGQITAGTTNNIIPETASMVGTIRSVSEASRSKVQANCCRVTQKIAEAHGARGECNITPGFPVTVNHGGAVQQAEAAAKSILSHFPATFYGRRRL